MSMLTIFNINDVNGAKVWLVHIEKANIFEDKIGHIMLCMSKMCEQVSAKFINK